MSGFGSRGRVALKGNCPSKLPIRKLSIRNLARDVGETGRSSRRTHLWHATQRQIIQRSSKRRTSGSNIKVTFTGAFSAELREVHPESSGLGVNEKCRSGVRAFRNLDFEGTEKREALYRGNVGWGEFCLCIVMKENRKCI